MARSGRSNEAIAILDQAVGYAEEAGHVLGYSLIAFLRGEARIHAEQYDQARLEMIALRELALSMPYPYVAAGALQVQAECALRTGRAREALDLFKAAGHEFEAIQSAHRLAQCQESAVRARTALGTFQRSPPDHS
jgi:hypothetical protein